MTSPKPATAEIAYPLLMDIELGPVSIPPENVLAFSRHRHELETTSFNATSLKLYSRLPSASGAQVRTMTSHRDVPQNLRPRSANCSANHRSYPAPSVEASLQHSSYYPLEHTYTSSPDKRRRRSGRYTLRKREEGTGYNQRMSRVMKST